jgi:putative ABC transport system permease protein
MRWLSELSEGLRALRGDLRRVVTTILGVAWGTFAVVGLGAFSTGLEESMATRAAGMGEAIVIVWPSRTTRSWQGFPEGRALRLSAEEARRLKSSVPGIAELSPEHSRYARVRRGASAFRPEVTGVDPDYGALRNLPPQPGGRFLHADDLKQARKVIFLGDRVAAQLFPNQDAVGQELLLAETPFTVVGVLQAKQQDSDYGAHDAARVFIPTSTYEQVFGTRFVDNFVVRAQSREHLPAVIQGVRRALSRSLSFDPADGDALNMWDTTEGDKIRSQAFDAMDFLTLLAGLFTVLVGAIGVGNLMFLVVRRRTAEIGLRMALGARPAWILRGVLLEALLLVGLGGLLGFLAASGIAVLVGASPLSADLGQPRISSDLALGVGALLTVVGLAAGWFPARRAARLDPALALAEGQ